jgi:hypothetical protein
MDVELFDKKYAEDKANQILQTKSQYMQSVLSFYEGNWLAKGWRDQSASLIEKVCSPVKAGVEAKLAELGKVIAAEWAKDNSVRKINTGHLQEWGNQLKAAKSLDDGSGTKILTALGSIEAAVAAKL